MRIFNSPKKKGETETNTNINQIVLLIKVQQSSILFITFFINYNILIYLSSLEQYYSDFYCIHLYS